MACVDEPFTMPKPKAAEMELRDYFAAKAMHAEIQARAGVEGEDADSLFHVAKMAYEMAEAMLKARAQ